MIDVSQSVEHDHPHASEFLRKDCMNVVEFFSKRISDQKVLPLKKLYDFITLDSQGIKVLLSSTRETENISDLEVLDYYFDYIHKNLDSELESNSSLELNQINEEVFKQIYIPRTLNELPDVEKLFQKININDSTEVCILYLNFRLLINKM